jgi:Carboxypeptidase regulatory-like domain/FG-GAP-like repeat/FG-GAP repeat
MRKVLLFSAPVLALMLFISLLPRPASRTVSASSDTNAFFASLKPRSAGSVKFAESEPLSAIAARAATAGDKKFDPLQIRQEPERQVPNFEKPGAAHDADDGVARILDTTMPPPSLVFDGMNNIDNGLNHGILVLPPDTNGDVGPNHYIQMMNILFRVFDKNGTALTPPLKMSSLFVSLGTGCSTRDDGEGSILYDPLADRWLMTQYCNLTPPFRQMVAVSKTGDPMGAWYTWEYVMPNFKQNDVSKFGVWHNAYYMSTEQFLGSDYAGTGAFAFDRDKMLHGDPTADFIYFDIPSTVGVARLGNLLPADMDGLTPPPANVSGLFMSYLATEYGDPQDALRVFEFKPNFGHPLDSTFGEVAGSPIPVAAFDPTSVAGRTDITQPPPGDFLDANSDRLMYRLAYRNFGNRESLVVNQTVRLTAVDQQYKAGVRVYELSRTSPTSPFTVNVQSTITGVPGENRWIGSAAEDHQGNLAVGYNTVSDQKKPAVVYSGRAATDPPNTFRSEASLVAGTGVQTAFGFRWGDYTNMTVDPADDCTFWYNGQYFTQESQDQSPFGWVTKIGRFKFDECTAAARGTIQGTVTNAATGLPLPDATVTLNTSFTRATGAQGNYNALLEPGTINITVSAHGYISANAQISLVNGATVTQNFALQPRAFPEIGAIDLTAESCGLNQSFEPGETVTVNVPMKNTGAADLNNVTVTLAATGGVTNPSAPQFYGDLPAGGGLVTRPFTFTVSPTLSCGAGLALSFQASNGSTSVSFGLSRFTGAPHFALNESFAGSDPNFPAGWTTSITGEALPWQKVQIDPNDFAAFSPEPVHPGINELVSPTIHITNANPVMSFRNKYNLESTFLRNLLYDGGVLEIKVGSGAFQDILAAGGQFTSLTGDYDGPIAIGFSNPLEGRRAWASKSGITNEAAWITSQVNLPPAAVGQDVQFRWRLATDIGGHNDGWWIDNVQLQDGVSCSCQNVTASAPPFDFDGDGKTDLSLFHPSDSAGVNDFEYVRSQNGALQGVPWGSTGDTAVTSDFDGDNKADFAVYRPSLNAWYILQSSNGVVVIATFGSAGDKVAPADFDGDGKDDIAVYRPSTGVWYVIRSSDGQFIIAQFGLSEDIPVQGDYDGDGKADIAVWRPSNGAWYVLRSSDGGFNIIAFGLSGDKPVPGDFDGDGKFDFVIFRPSEGVWYLFGSTAGFSAAQFGLNGDRPLQADFDGDGKRDIAVFRPGTNIWYQLQSSTGAFVINQYGNTGDQAVPASYVP